MGFHFACSALDGHLRITAIKLVSIMGFEAADDPSIERLDVLWDCSVDCICDGK